MPQVFGYSNISSTVRSLERDVFLFSVCVRWFRDVLGVKYQLGWFIGAPVDTHALYIYLSRENLACLSFKETCEQHNYGSMVINY